MQPHELLRAAAAIVLEGWASGCDAHGEHLVGQRYDPVAVLLGRTALEVVNG
jgi:hypothetical protein